MKREKNYKGKRGGIEQWVCYIAMGKGKKAFPLGILRREIFKNG